MNSSGMLFKIADFDSPKNPPVSIPGFVNVKKKKSLVRIAFQIHMPSTGRLNTYIGQYSHDRSRMKKRLHHKVVGDNTFEDAVMYVAVSPVIMHHDFFPFLLIQREMQDGSGGFF